MLSKYRFKEKKVMCIAQHIQGPVFLLHLSKFLKTVYKDSKPPLPSIQSDDIFVQLIFWINKQTKSKIKWLH